MEIRDKELRHARPKWPEVRCIQCNRLLFRGIVEDMEIKCSRCGTIQHIGECKQEEKMNVCNR
ncbi:Com family DNA-binding transcriptional regulator [Pelosinus propionicus]|uniref:Mu-like prophage protein Com n=1 Tax=Pelosinus propionicus DSM 13327 TaxID=1123291 RepID=A0A1I4N8G3_9FIRM|nr:Com family DNA-binding transcriptional regulator [Pelosinus propionicus]SFM11852.1 Mu-like prophage protein Com [Pelosinus propionicus DSM 13327]